MSDSQVMDGAGAAGARVSDFSLSRTRNECAAILLLLPILLGVALWNNYPIIFYDTGAYILQGLGGQFIMERSPVYSLFLKFASAQWSLWCVVAVQALMTAYVMVQFARAEASRTTVWEMLGIGVVLCTATGLPWYVGQIEPDFMTGLVAISFYLLAFRAGRMGRLRTLLLLAVATLSVASHPSHLALAAALLGALALLKAAAFVGRGGPGWPRPRIAAPVLAAALGMGLVIAANYALTKEIFLTRAGPVFLAARMMQDGIVKRLLDDACPNPAYRLCAYKDDLPARADAWLWERVSPFNRSLGGFKGATAYSRRIVEDSLSRYPLLNLRAAVADTALQFVLFQTGDGIDPQEWVLDLEFKRFLPRQLTGYLDAKQQRGELGFLLLNVVHVGVAALSLVAMAVLLARRVRSRQWNRALLPAFVFFVLLGNAFICGTLSGPHGRYQSRVIWIATFALLLDSGFAAGFALRNRAESAT
jgi:hypothetical protein